MLSRSECPTFVIKRPWSQRAERDEQGLAYKSSPQQHISLNSEHHRYQPLPYNQELFQARLSRFMNDRIAPGCVQIELLANYRHPTRFSTAEMAASGASNVYIHTVFLHTKPFLSQRYRQGVLTRSSFTSESLQQSGRKTLIDQTCLPFSANGIVLRMVSRAQFDPPYGQLWVMYISRQSQVPRFEISLSITIFLSYHFSSAFL